jgi:hypothetical protein
MSGRMNQMYRVFSFLHQDPVVRGKFAPDFAVTGKPGMVDLMGPQRDLDAAIAGDNQWTVAERVGTDRNQDHRIERRVENRTATRECICGRSCRRRDDDPI